MSRTYPPYSPPEPIDYPEHWDPAADHRYGVDDYPLDDEYADFAPTPADNRWKWVAGVAGAVLLVAVVSTIVILGGGDSGSVSATVAPPEPTQPAPTAPRTVIASPAPTQSLAPERITTVTPTPSATATPTPSAAAPVPEPTASAAPPPPAPRTVTYRVTGERPLLDLVTVIYTDAQGALQTEVNVALPWSKTIELNPGVELTSVTATSVSSQLNCAITGADGNTIVAHNGNTIIATCTR
ncbi:MmpS family transport accessory protein [Mycolicibacterium thermoresistibile]